MALNFPAKIYLILENESKEIIQWQNNGTSFKIMDHGRFQREVIPKYFRHNQLSSVQRQLNLYGFKSINRGEDKGAFYHTKFRQGDWESARKISRSLTLKREKDYHGKSSKKTASRKSSVYSSCSDDVDFDDFCPLQCASSDVSCSVDFDDISSVDSFVQRDSFDTVTSCSASVDSFDDFGSYAPSRMQMMTPYQCNMGIAAGSQGCTPSFGVTSGRATRNTIYNTRSNSVTDGHTTGATSEMGSAHPSNPAFYGNGDALAVQHQQQLMLQEKQRLLMQQQNLPYFATPQNNFSCQGGFDSPYLGMQSPMTTMSDSPALMPLNPAPVAAAKGGAQQEHLMSYFWTPTHSFDDMSELLDLCQELGEDAMDCSNHLVAPRSAMM